MLENAQIDYKWPQETKASSPEATARAYKCCGNTPSEGAAGKISVWARCAREYVKDLPAGDKLLEVRLLFLLFLIHVNDLRSSGLWLNRTIDDNNVVIVGHVRHRWHRVELRLLHLGLVHLRLLHLRLLHLGLVHLRLMHLRLVHLRLGIGLGLSMGIRLGLRVGIGLGLGLLSWIVRGYRHERVKSS